MLNWTRFRNSTGVATRHLVLLGALAVAVVVALVLAIVRSWTVGLFSLSVGVACIIAVSWWNPEPRSRVGDTPIESHDLPTRDEVGMRRRILIDTLSSSRLTLESRIELIYLVLEEDLEGALKDLAATAHDSAVTPAIRLEIASILVAHEVPSITSVLRDLAVDGQVSSRVRLEAAAMLLEHDGPTAAAALTDIVRSSLVPGDIRLDAAVIHAEQEPEDLDEERSGELLAYLASGAGASLWIRTEAAQRLAEYSRVRYLRALWTLANDPLLGPSTKFKIIKLLAEHAPDRAASCYMAIAHDPEQSWSVRISAAFRLEDVAAEEGLQTLLALVEDPEIDKRSRAEIVRKLTD